MNKKNEIKKHYFNKFIKETYLGSLVFRHRISVPNTYIVGHPDFQRDDVKFPMDIPIAIVSPHKENGNDIEFKVIEVAHEIVHIKPYVDYFIRSIEIPEHWLPHSNLMEINLSRKTLIKNFPCNFETKGNKIIGDDIVGYYYGK